MPDPHPNDAIPGDVVNGTFTIENNEVLQQGVSKTSLVTASENYALGSQGQTKAIAKSKAEDYEGRDLASSNTRYLTGCLFQDEQFKDNGKLGGDRGLLTRQVASYKTDQFLGLNSVTEEKFGIDKNGKVYGLSIQAPGEGINSSQGLMELDLGRGDIQRGLSDLEVSDYITGQLDRNPRNIFVDPVTGKVTGIDNDLSFPELARDEVLRQDWSFAGKAVRGLPQMMHKDTAEKILKINPKELEKMLKNMPVPEKNGPQPLSDLAIKGSVLRLMELQKAIKKGNIEVVDEFNEKTFKLQTQRQIDAFDNLDKSIYNDRPTWAELKINHGGIPGRVREPGNLSYVGSLVCEYKMDSYNKEPALRPIKEYKIPPVSTLPNSEQIVQRKRAYEKLDKHAKNLIDSDPKLLNKKLDNLALLSPRQQLAFNEQANELQNKLNNAQKQRYNPTNFITKLTPENKRTDKVNKLRTEINELSKMLDGEPSKIGLIESKNYNNEIRENRSELIQKSKLPGQMGSSGYPNLDNDIIKPQRSVRDNYLAKPKKKFDGFSLESEDKAQNNLDKFSPQKKPQFQIEEMGGNNNSVIQENDSPRKKNVFTEMLEKKEKTNLRNNEFKMGVKKKTTGDTINEDKGNKIEETSNNISSTNSRKGTGIFKHGNK